VSSESPKLSSVETQKPRCGFWGSLAPLFSIVVASLS